MKTLLTLTLLLATQTSLAASCNTTPMDVLKYKTKDELIRTYCWNMDYAAISSKYRDIADKKGLYNMAKKYYNEYSCEYTEADNAWLVLRKDFEMKALPTCKQPPAQ